MFLQLYCEYQDFHHKIIHVKQSVSYFQVSVQFSSVAQSCPAPCDPMNRSTPGLPVHHRVNSRSSPKPMSIESVMTSNHLILCCPLLLLPSILPSIRVFSNESVLSNQMVKVLEFQRQHQSFQWTLSTDLLEDGLVWSPYSPRDSQESSPAPQHQFFSAQLSL